MVRVARVAARFVAAISLPRKGQKYNGAFHGDDDGSWELKGYLRAGRDWEAAMSLSRENDWRNLMVDGATEHNGGFRKALAEMVREYPELLDFLIKFDGPWLKVRDLVGESGSTRDWSRLKLYHGTSKKAADIILVEGLRPRSQTNVKPAYGASSSVGAGRAEAIYLTTQINMAKFAAHDAARMQHSTGVVLEVHGLDERYVAADEDSGETDPEKSLGRIGSIAYLAPIPASKIQLALEMDGGRWTG